MANPNRPALGRTIRLLNVVGASARAAVFSALRGGAAAAAADLFADLDLRAVAAPALRVADYPDGLEKALARLPDAPFLYTGGLENHPDLVDALARVRPLLGNDGAILRRARDPFLLARALETAGVPMPETRRAAEPPPSPRGWLVKPRRGAGGAGIRPASGAWRRRPDGPFYFQRRVKGASHSAVYVAREGGAILLGATRQLVGTPWLHAAPFAWCGNMGPAPLDASVLAALERAGGAAARSFGLRGLFGIDFLLEEGPGGRAWAVDLNPRYPASAEVLEHALGFSAAALHIAACAGGDPASEAGPALARAAAHGAGRPAPDAILGKAVLYAPQALVATAELAALLRPDSFAFPALADVPAPGSPIKKGRPMLTVFARGATERECEEGLRRAAAAASRLFAPARHPSYYRPP